MKNITKTAILSILIAFLLSPNFSYADEDKTGNNGKAEVTSPGSDSQSSTDISLLNYLAEQQSDNEQAEKESPSDIFDQDEDEDEDEDEQRIITREPNELVNATANYLMSFEAYNMAKKSNDCEIRAKTPEYLRAFRIATSKLLKTLKEDGLYKPNKRKNYAGKYNKKMRKTGFFGYKTKVDPRMLKELRDDVKDAVAHGRGPEEIAEIVYAHCPIYTQSSDNSNGSQSNSNSDRLNTRSRTKQQSIAVDMHNDGSIDRGRRKCGGNIYSRPSASIH